MSISVALTPLFKQPKLLLKSGNIFLISHMRGNTSLLSHLLGNHPEIEGYYEMHIDYYSWKSLYRQKILYIKEHTLKKNSRYFFDKILHNEHFIEKKILQKSQSKIIIMLREPEQTIRSIISLYRKTEPNHPYCNAENATQYYIERLQGIQQLAQQMFGGFYYLQADELRQSPEQQLSNLQHYLGLNTPISTEYKNFKNTGKERYGDSSSNIKSGKIQKKSTDYSAIKLDEKNLSAAIDIYNSANKYLQDNAAQTLTSDNK